MIYATCKCILAAHEPSFHSNGLKQMKTGLNMAPLSWKETQMGVVWERYPRQLCLVFNFTGVILNGAECKPLRYIIFQHLMQRYDILAARWKHLLCQIKGQNKCQPGRPKQACPEGGSQDDVPQSLLLLHQINSDLQLGWHPGPQGRTETLTLHCTNTWHKTTAMGKGEDADTWVSIKL